MNTVVSDNDPRRPHARIELHVSGLHCTNCALSLERHLIRVGALAPQVEYASGRTLFTLTDPRTLPEVTESIKRLGYHVSEVSAGPTHSRQTALYIKTAVAATLTLPLLVAMLLPHSVLHSPIVQLVLTTPVFIIGITHFGFSALRSLRGGVANMDLLISCGILAGYTASIVTLIFQLPHDLIFFEAVASIVTFILVGHLLEERAVQKTSSAIEKISALQVGEARRLIPTSTDAEQLHSSEIEQIPISRVAVGDLLMVNSGDKIPTDGIIVQGSAALDEGMLSGESLPVDRGPRDPVVGGTIVVAGSVIVRATAVGDDTQLAAIVRLVRDAQLRKPAIQRVGDAASAWFVPIVLGVATAIFAGSTLLAHLSLADALVRALAVVVIACPCAMGLATPTAIMVALGRAAQNGILIRGGDTLERLAAVKQVAFDKTGTLTDGHLEITAFEVATSETQPTSPADAEKINNQGYISPQSVLVALQRSSSHPIARAITKHFSTTPAAPLIDIQEHRGIGVEGRDTQGNSYRCGGRVMAAQAGVTTTADVALLINNQLLATLRVRDQVRPEAAAVVREVTALGLGVSIISGDTARKCAEIAADVGISEVYSEQLPEQKLQQLRTKQVDTPVAYIGDGINDAPTLAEAAVGISIGSASDIAVQSAQVILTGNSLAALPKSIRLARVTVRTIKQNLAWAVLYNLFAIPLAALGYIPPLAAALLMTVSDVVIVGNSLRIKWQRLQ